MAQDDAVGAQQAAFGDDIRSLDTTKVVGGGSLLVDDLVVGVIDHDFHLLAGEDLAAVMTMLVEDGGPLDTLAGAIDAQVGVDAGRGGGVAIG